MSTRCIAVPCAGGALTTHETRAQTTLVRLHNVMVVTEAAKRVIVRPAAAPIQAVLHAYERRRQKVHHRIHYDRHTRKRLPRRGIVMPSRPQACLGARV